MDTATQKWTKGAVEAARRIFQDVGEVHALDLPRVAELISRETKDQEMADLLRQVTIALNERGDIHKGCQLQTDISALLSTLEKI